MVKGIIFLQDNAYIYLHGNEVGGTNPALLEAMAFGNCVLANGVTFNKEVVADSGMCFEPGNEEDLKNKMEYLITHIDVVEKYRILAPQRISEFYSWDNIVNQYDELFLRLKNGMKSVNMFISERN